MFRNGMVNRTGISASDADACMGSLVAFLRGAVIEPVHIELMIAETHPGDFGRPENRSGRT